MTATVNDRPGGFERRAFCADRVRPRRTTFSFPSDIPRYWLNGMVGRTLLMNSLHLFLPPFERMVTRLIHGKVLPLLKDPALLEQARGLMGQEAVHGRAHELFFANLRAQGFAIERYLRFLYWVFDDLFERWLGTKVTVAMIAGFEHYTDLLVSLLLEKDFLDGAEPHVGELLRWHAAEEVEHNAIAFDMLQAIDKSLMLRMLGSVLGLVVMFGLLLAGTVMLMAQDGKLTNRRALAELVEVFFGKYRVVPDAVRMFFHYARPGYRPEDIDYSALAEAVLAPDPNATQELVTRFPLKS